MAIPTINTTFKSTSISRGFFPSATAKAEIVKVEHSTYLSLYTTTDNFYMTCKVNGVDQRVKFLDELEYHKWHMDLVPGDVAEFTIRNWEKPDFSKVITFTITETGPEVVIPKGIRHSMEGTHKPKKDIQSKYRRGV
jgi:hypothetical protein